MFKIGLQIFSFSPRKLLSIMLALAAVLAVAPAQDYGWAMRAKMQNPGEAALLTRLIRLD